MNLAHLARAVRAIGDAALEAYTDELDTRRAAALRDAGELSLVLARTLEGKPLAKAFGAPGDWGYGTPIGDALAAPQQTTEGA